MLTELDPSPSPLFSAPLAAADPHGATTSPTCASYVAIRLLGMAVAEQALLYRHATYGQLDHTIATLARLHYLIRLGVCPQTAVLEDAELPPLDNYLQQLPEPLRVQVEAAIAAERRGECNHGEVKPMVLQEAEQVVRSLAARQPQLL